mmetsp:Transcript_96262/g.281163  ORF Transcript_96262/g.281163 Transcript_96262/m.281163 type:complete len:93 (+) Transcript_96262:721-999(+)
MGQVDEAAHLAAPTCSVVAICPVVPALWSPWWQLNCELAIWRLPLLAQADSRADQRPWSSLGEDCSPDGEEPHSDGHLGGPSPEVLVCRTVA